MVIRAMQENQAGFADGKELPELAARESFYSIEASVNIYRNPGQGTGMRNPAGSSVPRAVNPCQPVSVFLSISREPP
jgi:hypothetical protein